VAESAVFDVAPKSVQKAFSVWRKGVLARKRTWHRKNAKKIRARKAAHYRANREEERAKRAATRQWRRAQNRISSDELSLYQADPLREERLKRRDFVVCRECGEKKTVLYNHVPKLHKLIIQDYLEKWNGPPACAPSFQEKARSQRKKWGASHGGNYFGGKRYLFIGGRDERSPIGRRGKRSLTPAVRRHIMQLQYLATGKPRVDRLGKKFDRKTGTWRQAEPASDAQIVELRLAGKLAEEIAAEVGLTQAAVTWRLRRIGFPAGHPCRFLHGEPVTKKHFLDLCRDFGVDRKTIIKAAGGNYWSVVNHLSHLNPTSVLTTKRADIVLNVRNRWTEAFCIRTLAGKRVRDFLASELLLLPTLRALLRDALKALRLWARSTNGNGQPQEILNWICRQSRAELVDPNRVPNSAHAFRALMFLWPAVKDLNERRPGFLAGRRFIDELVDELLGRDYDTAPSRVAQAAQGELTALDPRTLGQRILEAAPAHRPTPTVAPPKKSRGGRPARKRPLFRQADELYKQLGSWGLVAKKLVPAEYAKDPRGAADRLRLGVKHVKQVLVQTASEKT
jgi:hypothetical protein